MSQVAGRRLTYAQLTGEDIDAPHHETVGTGQRGTVLARIAAGLSVALRFWPRRHLFFWNPKGKAHGIFKLFPCVPAFVVFCFSFHHYQIMRLFQVAALSLLLVTLPSNGSQQQKPPDSKQPSTQQSQSNPTITVSDNHYSATIQGNRAQEESKRWPPPWYSPFWPNWAFVFVGLGAAVAAVWTLFKPSRINAEPYE